MRNDDSDTRPLLQVQGKAAIKKTLLRIMDMQRCSRCILPVSWPGADFDKNGVCGYCRDFKPFAPQGREALQHIVDAARTAGGKYDCIVPLSGGRDSTFVLYYAKEELGLRPIAINFDNETKHPQAQQNMEKACAILGVDLEVVQSRFGIAQKLLRANVRVGLPLGLATLSCNVCRQCTIGYTSAPLMKAEQYHVPLVLWGASTAESTSGQRKKALNAEIKSRFLKLLSPHMFLSEYYSFIQRCELRVPGNSIFSRNLPKLKNSAIREIKFFDYVTWDRALIKETIMDKLEWRKPDGAVSSWRTDCTLHELVNYVCIKMLGCTNDCLGYCNMIRAGQMSREEALFQEEYLLAHSQDNIEKLLQEVVGLKRQEIERFMKLSS